MVMKIDIQKKIEDFKLDIQLESNSRRIGILGPSGCGKSMTLKCIAGIETPDVGIIEIDNNVLFDKSKKINQKVQKRNVGYLFQNYALFPTMSVEQNISIGVEGKEQKYQKISKTERAERIQELIKMFRLEGLEKKLPGELSGGQQQRVALARIFAYEPDVILLDEPFAALDMFLKNRLQQELLEMLDDFEGTVIMVSHSRDEIYRFSDELLIIDNGSTVISGKTKEIFQNPKKIEAARLTGCKNFSRVRRIDAHHLEVSDWGIQLELSHEIPEDIHYIGYRAHEFEPIWSVDKEEHLQNALPVKMESMAELPFEKQYYLKTESMADEIEPICWFVQKDKWNILEEKGLPMYLRLKEEHILFLE